MIVVGFLIGFTLGTNLGICLMWRRMTVYRDQFRYTEAEVNAAKTAAEHYVDRCDMLGGRIQRLFIQHKRTADARYRPLP